jgi:hypothetical protein
MYPYGLTKNPFPIASTPGDSDIELLGGKKHKRAKSLVVSCIDDMEKKMQQEYDARHFRLITVIQDVGSGKTHLALHLRRCSELSDKAILSFTDLSQLMPKTIDNFYKAMMKGFNKHQLDELRFVILNQLRERAEREEEKDCRKIFGYNLWDRLKGNSLENKSRLILENKLSHDKKALEKVLAESFPATEASMIQLIVGNTLGFNHPEVNNLEEMLSNVSALARIIQKFLDRVTIFEIDEFDADRHSMELLKAMINLHLPSTVLFLVLTPSTYDDIRKSNASLYDRLEKANYRIELAGSNALEEICEIIVEYIEYGLDEKRMKDSDQVDLRKKLKILYDEFPDFRNIRSMINVMYHAMEHGARNGSRIIDEQTLDQTISSIYPGLKLRENFMSLPISEFIKIAEESMNFEGIKSRVALAISLLLSCARDNGRVTQRALLRKNGSRIEMAFDDFVGTKTALEFSVSEANVGCIGISPIGAKSDVRSKGPVNQVICGGDNNLARDPARVQVDRHKLVDLLYFGNKYKNNQLGKDEIERALALGEALRLY